MLLRKKKSLIVREESVKKGKYGKVDNNFKMRTKYKNKNT